MIIRYSVNFCPDLHRVYSFTFIFLSSSVIYLFYILHRFWETWMKHSIQFCFNGVSLFLGRQKTIENNTLKSILFWRFSTIHIPVFWITQSISNLLTDWQFRLERLKHSIFVLSSCILLEISLTTRQKLFPTWTVVERRSAVLCFAQLLPMLGSFSYLSKVEHIGSSHSLRTAALGTGCSTLTAVSGPSQPATWA